MRPSHLPSARYCLQLVGLALLMLGCDSAETTRQIIISRPASPIVSTLTATPLLSPPTLHPTPTLSAEIAEYDAVVQYWNSSIALTNQMSDAYNDYVLKTTPYITFDEYKQHKDTIVPTSDQLVTVIDKDIVTLQALKPPPRAAAYHNAVLQYWQEYRAYVSDLRQGIDHDNPDLWNQGISRQAKLNTLLGISEAEKKKIYDGYIVPGRAK
jgi:hypothetical protein